MKLLIIVAFCLAVAQAEVCYDTGCYDIRPPFGATFERPIAVLPQSPDKIAVQFRLYTRANPTTHKVITHTALDPLFDLSKPTKFVIHGFFDNMFSKHFLDMKDALLSAGDFNVVMVDWSKGAFTGYTQAVANTRVVGDTIARLVNTYAQNYGLNVDNVHIIGHSLGAHTAGYAGAKIPRLGRITGLDPAGPGFEKTPTIVRLDEGDAKFVDVIHTDATATLLLGLGILQRSGHADFYVNGGKNQPSCPQTSGKLLSFIFNIGNILQTDFDGVLETTACSHMAAVYFFTDSIRNADCVYTSYKCSNQDEFDNGDCLSCSVFGCNQMGFWASPTKETGALYLNTQGADRYPYCGYFYKVKLNSNNLSGQTQARGSFKITLNGEKTTSTILPFDDDIIFKSGTSQQKLIQSAKYIGETVQSATVSYTLTNNILISWLFQNQWSFKSIDIIYGNSQYSVRLCPTQTYIKSGASVVFTRC